MSQEQKAKEYNRKKIFIEITETILLIIFLTFFMAFGWSLSIKNFLSAFTSSFWLLNGLYCLTLLVMITLLSSPFDYYSGFYLEHKYELSTQKPENQYNIIFMDNIMPDKNGISVTKEIKDQNKYQIAIIAASASIDEATKNNFIKAGVDGFLETPISTNNLNAILSQYTK